MSGLVSTVRSELEDKEFRAAYVAENVRRGLAYQIQALREAQGWSRAEFARQAQRPQSNVSRWENPTYGKFNLTTLAEIAAVFDVALSVRFVSFGELLDSVSTLRPSKLAPQNYEAERRQADQNQFGGSALKAFFESPDQRIDDFFDVLRATANPPKGAATANPPKGPVLPPMPTDEKLLALTHATSAVP